MTNSDEVTLPHISASGQERPLRTQAEDKPAERSSGGGRLHGLLLFMQLAIVACLVLGSYAFNLRMNAAEKLARDQINRITELSGLATNQTNETLALRQFIASQSRQEIIFLKVLALKPSLNPREAAEISRHVYTYAKLYGYDPDLVLSIMHTESRFDKDAVSNKGAEGLMQVMPQWKKVLGIKDDLKDPETSVKVGLQIFGFYREMYQDIQMALIAYNRGPGPVDMALMKGKDPANGYATKVMDTYNRLKAMSITRY